ncbi:MAG: hypothetical protein ABW061_13875 [Polyangiaceae bacterium]
MKKVLVLLLSAGLLVLGCSKSEPAPPPVTSAAPVTPPIAAPAASVAPDPTLATVDPSLPLNNAAPVAAAAAPAVAAKAVPTEADYEVKAESTITPANAAQVLAAIDAQVGK